ncbi:hypothetical protein [Streptomyces sp. NPDC001851]|uniref:hypothetical protein n=1 Tax=Streptomyces sp. NPDC001851 TaxID=3154529 RepID=UPI003323668A
MIDYFRLETEAMDYRDAVVYYEFINCVPSRQVTNVDDLWLSSRRNSHPTVGPLLTDQLLQPGEFPAEARISPEEFNMVWQRAIEQEDRS